MTDDGSHSHDGCIPCEPLHPRLELPLVYVVEGSGLCRVDVEDGHYLAAVVEDGHHNFRHRTRVARDVAGEQPDVGNYHSLAVERSGAAHAAAHFDPQAAQRPLIGPDE